jgi:hypothetical protein
MRIASRWAAAERTHQMTAMHYLLFMALGALALSVESEAAALGHAAASTLPGAPELTVPQPQAVRAETYRSAGLDADGNLTILVADGTICST